MFTQISVFQQSELASRFHILAFSRMIYSKRLRPRNKYTDDRQPALRICYRRVQPTGKHLSPSPRGRTFVRQATLTAAAPMSEQKASLTIRSTKLVVSGLHVDRRRQRQCTHRTNTNGLTISSTLRKLLID